MARLAILLFIIASSADAMGQATTSCPWLTTGTAAKLLGGEVTVVAHVDGSFAGSCRFVRQSGDLTASIEVLVGSTDSHLCPEGSIKLNALGNAAVQCHVRDAYIIAGRIRDVYFAVSMTNLSGATKQEPDDPRLADAYGASALERIAEQVVGNLY
jgi:hypothetical protein